MTIKENILRLKAGLPEEVELVAVSKTCSAESILQAYQAGQRIFGESRPQEMRAKYGELPKDIRWHMIGHLQTNKVKYIAPFVNLIHSVDSAKLFEAIDIHAVKNARTIDVLLEVCIAEEETKHGWQEDHLIAWLDTGIYREATGVRIRGLMGIATNTDDREKTREEFSGLARLYLWLKEEYFGPDFDTLSMGMTSDYNIAVECGANMVRIGSMIFGERNYGKQ
ncbi:MAG: YggS family pyridoxal phosphate-dependent enzyme [Rikenellaceae bacterium]|nr:YggS family pyridoxal phosphate-dependent enzyme [Rikenellaceae bacterium]